MQTVLRNFAAKPRGIPPRTHGRYRFRLNSPAKKGCAGIYPFKGSLDMPALSAPLDHTDISHLLSDNEAPLRAYGHPILSAPQEVSDLEPSSSVETIHPWVVRVTIDRLATWHPRKRNPLI